MRRNAVWIASVVVALVLASCKSQPITCGKGTHEVNGTCVADREPPVAKPLASGDPSTAPKGSGTLALVIVMNSWEMWIGNDKEVPQLGMDDPSRFPGVLIELRSALDKHKLSESGPAGSLGMVITYGDKPVIRVPMGPLAEITGGKLGTQADYFGTTGVELVSAIRLALAELKKAQASRRVLIVIGDGNDTNNDLARSQLRDLKKQAAQDRVETFGIVYKAKLSGEENVLPIMIPNTKQIGAAKEIDAALAAIRAQL